MRLVELFLKETSMEDRAIISLAQAIYDYVDTNYNFGAAKDPSELTERSPFDIENDDFGYDDEEDDFGNIEDPVELEHQLGTIGALFDTPLEALNNVNIILTTPEGMLKKQKELNSNSGAKEAAAGMWVAPTDDMILNMDYFGTRTLKSVIAHELRHALDDVKSDYKTSRPEKRYNQPKKKPVDAAPEDEKDYVRYLAQPAEINARFVQVLHDLVPIIQRAAKLEPEQGKALMDRSFQKLLASHNLTRLFPEKAQSKDYKRLVKRGVDFMNKEFEYIKSQQK